MFSLLGRLIVIAGSALIVYSLFLPIYTDQMPSKPQEMGGIVITPPPLVYELSLYNLGGELEKAGDSVQDVPQVLNYLWLIFALLALINFLLAFNRKLPKILRLLVGLLPLALLAVVFYQTGTDPQISAGFNALYEKLSQGFFLLLGGALAIVFGSLLIKRKRKRRYVT